MRVLAIDPGPTESAFVLYNDGKTELFGKQDNHDVLAHIEAACRLYDALVVEKIESFGMAVGAEVFETVWWSGRFAQVAHLVRKDNHRLPRKAVKMHLCGSMRAKDGNIRQALIDRFGGKDAAIGKKKSPGPLYGISGDCWSALAVAVTWADMNAAKPA